MSDTRTEASSKHIKSPVLPEVIDSIPVEVERLRRSERVRTLTEKGRELQEIKLKGVQRQYRMIYEKWKYHARKLSNEDSQDELNVQIENIESSCSELKAIYEELHRVQTPEQDLQRRIDACISLSGFIVKRAQEQCEGRTLA